MTRFCKTMTVSTIVACTFALVATLAIAETPVPILRENDPLPGAPGETIDSISNPVVNHAGGFAVTVNTEGSGVTLSNIWGNATGGPGALIITEGTFGNLQQSSFESFHGLSDAGDPAYSASSEDLITGTTGLDGVWVGPVVILNEEDPIAALPGQFSTFNSRPGITADGIPYWVGGISEIQGGSSQNRVLFFGAGATPVLMGGDSIGGVAEPIETGSSNIDFDFRFSAFGTNYIVPVVVETGSNTDDGVIVINGSAAMFGGSIVREASPIPLSIGGLPVENWDNFDFLGISESGAVFMTGDTDADSATDEFVLVDGLIVMREGDMVMTPSGMVPLAGSIEGGYRNEDGDWAVIWDVDSATGNIEALIFNGEVVLLEGEEVDFDGNGMIDPGAILRNFTGISALVVGDRTGGVVSLYFTADIDTEGTSSSSDDTEILFRLDIPTGDAIQAALDIKPGSCPNPFNKGSQGVLPVALVGTMDFDVLEVDLSSLQLSRADGMGGSVAPLVGPPGPHPEYEDSATPFEGDMCECHEEMSDGIVDIGLKFSSSLVTNTLGLGMLPKNTVVELIVSGTLMDGTPFVGSDCIVIKGKNTGPIDEPDGGVIQESQRLGLNGSFDPPDSATDTQSTPGDEPGEIERNRGAAPRQRLTREPRRTPAR